MGLTYKENVDDVRESPTLQLYDCMRRHLADGARFYDPMVKTTLVERQYFEFDAFLDGLKLVVVMVAHDEIRQSTQKLKNLLVFDTRNCVSGENVVKL
jgi:UDP-N-acetyl-D-mannosaminuronic acid dehydrogenase